jgi:hypothetical protein
MPKFKMPLIFRHFYNFFFLYIIMLGEKIPNHSFIRGTCNSIMHLMCLLKLSQSTVLFSRPVRKYFCWKFEVCSSQNITLVGPSFACSSGSTSISCKYSYVDFGLYVRDQLRERMEEEVCVNKYPDLKY